MEITDGNRWVARSFGSDLLAHITATMQQLLHGTEIPTLRSKPADKMVYYAGHDISAHLHRIATPGATPRTATPRHVAVPTAVTTRALSQ
jgi:hypothetical protein